MQQHESQKYYVERKKVDTREHILYDYKQTSLWWWKSEKFTLSGEKKANNN